MRGLWVKLLLLGTFAFWASGVAKYAHELTEHRAQLAAGGSTSTIYDDDDDAAACLLNVKSPAGTNDVHSHPVKHPCPVCQLLAAMSVDRTSPPELPTLSQPLVEIRAICNRVVPNIAVQHARSARAPPLSALPLP